MPKLCRRERLIQEKQGDAEKLDKTPIHIPGDCQRPPTLREEMQRFVREQISLQVSAQESQTGSFEDEDDFDIPDPDEALLTPYNVVEAVPEEGMPLDDLEGDPKIATDNTLLEKKDGEAIGSEAETPAPSPVTPPDKTQD